MSAQGRPLLLIALGGAIGAVARYELGLAVRSRIGDMTPGGSAMLNLAGSLLVGLALTSIAEARPMDANRRLFLISGVCGGYTTCAAFSPEAFDMITTGAYERAVIYMAAGFMLSVVGAMLGAVAATRLAISVRARRAGSK